MAVIGNNDASPDMDYTSNLENLACSIEITMPEAGTSVSIWWYGTTTTAASIGAAIYTGQTGTLVDEEASIYAPGEIATAQWHEIPLGGVALSATTYTIAIASGTASSGSIAKSNGGSDNGLADWYLNGWTGTWPTTASFINGGAQSLTMYLEYTTAGGGGDPEGRLIGGKLIRGGLLRSGVL